jgi:Aminoglycoside/hydroxyurea antibiotic resistance kinase
MRGVCALVLPVRTTDGVPAVLKLTWPHPEACDEHLASGLVNGARGVRPPDGIRRPAFPHVYWTMRPPYSAISWEPPVRSSCTPTCATKRAGRDREQWLAIDPKPLVGDAAFEVAPLLWNRWDEAISSADLGTHLRWRADVVAERAGLDRGRVAGWVVVREVVEADRASYVAR